MKIKILLLSSILIILLIIQIYLASSKISFSHKSGFYDNEFYLSIKTDKNSKIFYTTDSSEPTINSIPYTEPILIKDVSKNPNFYSARKDMSFQSLYDKNTIKIPTELVDKASIIRVAKYDKNNNLIKEDHKIFFVGFKDKKGYDNLHIVSVIMNPNDILDEEKGIFVLGKEKDAFCCPPEPNKQINFWQRGDYWERKAIIDIFDKGHKNTILSQNARIRIKGGISRKWNQKSMSFRPEGKNKKTTYFEKNIFRKNIKLYNLVLFNGGDQIHTKIKDYLIQTFEEKTNSKFATLRMIPCVVFLNGEYWGLYYLSENYNKHYIHTIYNIKKSNILMKDKTILTDFFENTDMSKDENYKQACRLIDIESFIDYFATEIYIANSDWPDNNCTMWRTKSSNKYKKYADTKWRWMLFDVNADDTLTAYNYDSFKNAIKFSPIFKSLIKNKTFKEKFKQRLIYLQTQVYTIENVNKFIDEWYILMNEPLKKSNNRFLGENKQYIFEEEIEKIRIFIEKRPEYIDKYYKKHLLN
ncbi:MAG: CotH kinase family protein [Candidatus Avigastranaerophilus sp.]